jgi:hypothetical protein
MYVALRLPPAGDDLRPFFRHPIESAISQRFLALVLGLGFDIGLIPPIHILYSYTTLIFEAVYIRLSCYLFML